MVAFALADVAVLLAQQPALAPPRDWRPRVDVAFDRRPSVLVIGRGLAAGDRSALERSGVVFEHVPTLDDALTRMEAGTRDVVVVSPAIAEETDGLRFVRAFKCSDALVGASDSLQALRKRYARTPFVVQPLDGDSQFAIFESGARWFLGNTWSMPLPKAILDCVR